MLNIIALRYISFSEIQKTNPEITPDWAKDNLDEFHQVLFQLGMDISIPYDWQTNIPHRNYFNEVVTCDRICGNERTDLQWLESGLASREAYDRSKNNRIPIDLYRMKGMVESE